MVYPFGYQWDPQKLELRVPVVKASVEGEPMLPGKAGLKTVSVFAVLAPFFYFFDPFIGGKGVYPVFVDIHDIRNRHDPFREEDRLKRKHSILCQPAQFKT